MRILAVSFFVYQGLWGTLFCEAQVPATSEIQDYSDDAPANKRSERDSPGYCPDGWHTFGDNCYKPFGVSRGDEKDWHGAVRNCASIGGNLTSIHSKEEQVFLNAIVWDLSGNSWIGLRRPYCPSYSTSRCSYRDYKWQDNSPTNYWNNGYPDFLTTERCVYTMYYHDSIYGKWESTTCNTKLPYICKKPKDPTLKSPGNDPFVCMEPEGWLKVKSTCYKMFNETEMITTWNEAESFCNKYAGNLASVRNYGVTVHLSRILDGAEGPYWIGVKSMPNQEYTWLGIDRLSYTNWRYGEPRELSEELTCVAMDVNGRWTVRLCNESYPFICEVREDIPTLAPHHLNTTCPTTSPKWKDLGGKYCYIVEVGGNFSYPLALNHCCREGGTLASFHSIDDVNVIVHQGDYHANVYIGLLRGNDGEFAWNDGSVIDFVNWDRQEPNSRDDKCTVMYASGRWRDVSCNSLFGYVCSTLKVPKTEETKALGSDSRISAGNVAVIVVCLLVGVVVVGVAVKYFFFSGKLKDQSLLPDTE